jgi:hypothetical protein
MVHSILDQTYWVAYKYALQAIKNEIVACRNIYSGATKNKLLFIYSVSMNIFWMIIISSCLLFWPGGQSQQLIHLRPVDSLGADHQEIWKTFGKTIVEKLEETGVQYDAMSAIQNIFLALKSSSFPTAVAKNISQQCLEDSRFYVRNLYANQSLWALQSK